MPVRRGSEGDDALAGTGAEDDIGGLGGDDTIAGGAGNDLLAGGDGDDSISGDAGDDVLLGGAGIDTLHGGDGADVIDGGLGGFNQGNFLHGDAGDDLFVNPNGMVFGGEGDDSVMRTVAGSFNNMFTVDGGLLMRFVLPNGEFQIARLESVENLYGGDGSDTFWFSTGPGYAFTCHGGEGNDFFVADSEPGAWRDAYFGDGGDDFFQTGLVAAGNDFYGGDGDDSFLVLGTTDDHIDGGAGIDTVEISLDRGVLGSDIVDLGSGQIVWRPTNPAGPFHTFTITGVEIFHLEYLGGSAIPMTILGTDGDDVIVARLGVDFRLNYWNVYGGDGNDIVLSNSDQEDFFHGGEGADVLDGWRGNDQLSGDAGDDVLIGDLGDDTLDGGAGLDAASYETASSAVTVNLSILEAQNTGAGLDTLVEVENLIGSDFHDVLIGDSGSNELDGGVGDDSLDGAGGVDTASYVAAGSAVTVNLSIAGSQDTLGSGHDALANIENVAGSRFDDALTGDAGANLLAGGDGADRLAGLAGADRLDGGTGADMLEGGANDDVLIGADGDDILAGGAGDDALQGGGGRNTASFADATASVSVNLALGGAQNTGAGLDTLTGISGLIGSAFNDTLTGDAADNVFEGALGNDTLVGGGGLDTASYAGASAGVFLNLGAGALQDTGAAGIDTLNGIANLRGSAFNDELWGNSGANVIEGGLGNDSINGAGGVDAVSYEHSQRGVRIDLTIAAAQDTVGAGLDTLQGVENVIGSRFTDIIHGNAGNNLIIGGGGASDGFISGGDNIFGGAGDDTLIGGLGGGVLDGEAGDDTIFAGDDADNIYGLDGWDTLSGGGGDDIYHIDRADDVIVEDAGGGRDHVHSLVDFVLPENVEALYLGESPSPAVSGTGNGSDNEIHGNLANNSLQGLGGADWLIGDYGDDVLDGGAGADRLWGGFGDDVYIVDNLQDAIEESENAGVDSVVSSADFILPANVEDLTLAGAAEFGMGNALANVLAGNGAANFLMGGAGDDRFLQSADGPADRIFGDAGFDAVDYGGASAGVIVQLSGYATTAAGTLLATLTSIEAAIGSSFNDTLVGNASDNMLTGGAGADWLVGGAGDDRFAQGIETGSVDRLFGDAGIDTLDYGAASAGVVVQLAGYSTVNGGATLATFTGIENAIGTAFADALIGNASNNSIAGGAGADWLVGGAGDDTFVQGLEGGGVDRLFGDAGIDAIDYSGANAGVTVQLSGYSTSGGATLATFTGIENAIGTAFADVLVGNASDNRIAGGQGADWLVGGAGNDTFVQGVEAGGVDRIFGDAGTDTLDYSGASAGVTVQLSGYSTVNGGAQLAAFAGIESAIGASFSDALIGNATANSLTGGGGADWLVGGGGADTFVYKSITDGAGDSIRDFSQVENDLIDLSAIDADATLGGDQFFSFATSRTAGVVGEAVVTSASATVTTLSLHLDADNVADMVVQIVHQPGLIMDAGDFVF